MSDKPVALITGAGGGLGRAICERFVAAGYQVVASDLAAESLDDISGLAATIGLDVASTPSVQAGVELLRQRFDRLDVLVNNAGIIGYFPVVETDPEELIRHFQVNSFGALRLTHACLDLLIAGRGRVLNISSESWKLRTPFQIYQPTKLALEGISDVLRRELVHLGVHVATIRPGAIDTALFHAMDTIDNPVADSRLAAPFDRFARMLARDAPKKRSTPAEVAELVFEAATDSRKCPHYRINNMWRLRLMAWLPAGWTDRILFRLLR